MRKIFVTLCAAVVLMSCGGKNGGSNGISKDAKADFQLADEKALQEIGNKDEATRNTYEGKIVEMKGFIKGAKESKSAASPNKYSFYLCATADAEAASGTICYSDTDQKANEGKPVTVKGHFDYAGVVTLDDCVAY